MFATSSCCKHDITFTSTLVTNSYPVFQAPGKPPTLSSAVCYCTTPLWTNSSWLLFSAEKHKEKCSYHVQWAETITEKVFKRLMNQSGKQWGCSEDLHGSLGIKLSSSLRCLPQDVSRVLSCPQEVTLKPPWCLQMPICMHMARLSLCQRHKCMQINLMDPQISAQRSVCLSHWFITFWTLHGHLHQIPMCVMSPGVRLCSGLKRIFFLATNWDVPLCDTTVISEQQLMVVIPQASVDHRFTWHRIDPPPLWWTISYNWKNGEKLFCVVFVLFCFWRNKALNSCDRKTELIKGKLHQSMDKFLPKPNTDKWLQDWPAHITPSTLAITPGTQR